MPSAIFATAAALRIGIVVGESCGDVLGAALMQAIKARYPNASFEGIAGPKVPAHQIAPLHQNRCQLR